jgi:hypothetical protein
VTTGDRRSDSYVYNINEIKRKKGNAKKVGKSDNVTLGKRGNSKAHSLSVLKRKAGVVPGGMRTKSRGKEGR